MFHRCYPSFFIFAFFLLSQSVDFTCYKPKEVIIWSLMLLGLPKGNGNLNGSDSARLPILASGHGTNDP